MITLLFYFKKIELFLINEYKQTESTVSRSILTIQFQLGSLSLSKVCKDSVVVIKSIFDLAVDQMAQLKV